MNLDNEQRDISLSSQHKSSNRNPQGSMNNFMPYALRRKNGIFQEITMPDDIKVNINEFRNELNPEIWDGMKLKKEIRYKQLQIAKAFYKFLKIDAKLKDVIFTGSMANYNWTSTSDIDLHLILDLKSMSEPREFIDEYLIAKKIIWNDKRNITIKGFEVELYSKSEETLISSKGVYSVLKDSWIQKPNKKSPEIDEIAVKEKAATLMDAIDSASNLKNDNEKIEATDKIKAKLKKLRQSGLDTPAGEYSIENLAFKVLRKNGYLDKLINIRGNAIDNSLSLNETLKEDIKKKKSIITESKKNNKHKYTYGCLMLDFDNITNWNQVIQTINSNDIYNKPEYGIEKEPHVTILFGLHSNEVDIDSIKNVIKNYLKGKNKINVSIKGMSLFEGEQNNVLKFDVESEDLNNLNKLLREFPHTNDFPNYQPHITIAYLNPGAGKKYVKNFSKPIKLSSGNFSYSYPPKEKKYFNTNDLNMATLGVQKGITNMTPEKIEIIEKFISFVVNRLNLKEPVNIYLHKGRDEYIVTTASYVPSENSNHVRAEGRALVDILRSIAHELTHNKQREIGSFKMGEQVQNVGGWIEDEANAKAGILIKDFALNLDNEEIYEL